MPLNPRFFEMGAKTWRDPLTHQKWIEEEKLRLQAAKHKVAEEKLAKEVENASSKLAQKEIAEKGRLIDEQKKDEYLARLKADVARLEAKQTGKVQDPLKDILEYDEERVVTQGDQREKELEKEVQLTAAEMLKLREKELEEKKKRQEKEMADLADRRRRELLEYKHALGLSHDHQRPQRPPLVSRRPLSLHDDPEFWKLDDSDRHRLELIHPDERIQYGFGPYEEDEIERELALRGGLDEPGPAQPPSALAARQLVQKMKEFVCTEETHVAGLTKIFEPISHAVPLDLPDLATLTPQDQQQAELTIQEEAQLLQDELVRFAIQQYGANALLSFQIDGPLPVEDPPLQQEGWIYELRANGIPALVAKAKPQSRAGYGAFPSQHNKPAGRIPRSRYPQDGGLAGRRFGDSPLFGLEDDFLAGLGRGTHGASAGYVGSLGIGGAPARRGVAGTGWKQPAADWGGGGSLFGRDHDFGLFDDPLAAQSRFSTAAAQPALPAHLKNLPWAAQQYVKRMRALQEQEEAEALARAAGASTCLPASPRPVDLSAGSPAAGPRQPGFAAPRHQQMSLPLHYAARPPMTGASPTLRPSTATNLPHLHANRGAQPLPTHTTQSTSLAEPVQPEAAGRGVFRLAGGLFDRLRGKDAAPLATTDPDHGSGGQHLGQGGMRPAAAPGQSLPQAQPQPQRVVPSKENGWRGAQPW